MVYRVYVEKRAPYDEEARRTLAEFKSLPGVQGLERVRLLNRYDVEGLNPALFAKCLPVVFYEPQVDDALFELPEADAAFAVEYLPGQFDAFAVNNDPDTGIPLRNEQPNSTHWLGTNSIGQDLWSRLWQGTRTSLLIGLAVACIEAVIGITVGVLWGYVRQLDIIFTELYNILDNIPSTVVLILVSYMLRPGVGTIILAMSITSWIGMARFIRNQIIIIRDREYNLASRCLGTPVYRIILRNLLPYLVSVVMLRMALSIPAAIGSEVFITYIGLGLPATVPSLGNLINEGRTLMMSPNLRYQLIYPTIILSIVTISFYVVGNAFSDAADPKNHR